MKYERERVESCSFRFCMTGYCWSPLEAIISPALRKRNGQETWKILFVNVYGVTPIVEKLDEIITEHAPECTLRLVSSHHRPEYSTRRFGGIAVA